MEITMRRLFLALLFTTLAGQALGAVYYVDCNADGDAGAGTSTAADVAWKTIAKVNGETFSAGDNVLFNKGCTWREQLVPPSSGSAGNVITFGSYGTGAKPVISYSTNLDNWVAAEGTWNTAKTLAFVGDASNGANFNQRTILPAAMSSYNGSKVRLTLKAHSDADTTLTGVSIGVMTTSNTFDTTPTRITFGGDNDVVIPMNTTVVSDEISFDFDKSLRHGIHIYNSAATGTVWGSGLSSYFNYTGVGDKTLVTTFTPDNNPAEEKNIALIEVYQAATNQWYSADLGVGGVDPVMVTVDGTPVKKVANQGALVDASWAWDNTNKYVLYMTTADPSTQAVWCGQQGNNNIDIGGRNYLVFDGLNILGPTLQVGAGINLSAGTTFTNCDFKNFYNAGVFVYAGSGDTKLTVSNSTFTDAGGHDNFLWFNGVATTGSTLTATGNSFTTSFFDGTAATDSLYVQAIYVNKALTTSILNNTITFPPGVGMAQQPNSIYVTTSTGVDIQHNTVSGGGHGIRLNASQDNAIIAYNYVHDTGDDNFWTDGTSGAGIVIKYNIFDGALDDSVALAGVTDGFIYNNLFSRSRDTGLQFANAVTGMTVKNNIFYNNGQPGDPVTGDEGYYEIYVTTTTGHEINNNLYYHTTVKNPTDHFYWGGVAYDFADWKTNSSQDNASLNDDPLFTSTVTPDFSLQAGSPAINAGVDVGLTSDYRGMTVPQGSAPDIGAYEFGPGDPGFLKGAYRGTMGIHWMW
jgi:parallel beta-helix repeat protein